MNQELNQIEQTPVKAHRIFFPFSSASAPDKQ